jgi:hypothetical protein
MLAVWTCSVCGVAHEGLPLDGVLLIPRTGTRSVTGTTDFSAAISVIPTEHRDPDYFVRGMIEIPILDGTTEDEIYFGIGAWTSLSKDHFEWYSDNWEADREAQGDAWFGWLSNTVPVYPETLNLKSNVLLRGEKLRPLIALQPGEHPLSIDQHEGITLARARELATRWLHH